MTYLLAAGVTVFVLACWATIELHARSKRKSGLELDMAERMVNRCPTCDKYMKPVGVTICLYCTYRKVESK